MEVLRELTDADEPSAKHADLPHDIQAALEEVREKRLAMVGRGSML